MRWIIKHYSTIIYIFMGGTISFILFIWYIEWYEVVSEDSCLLFSVIAIAPKTKDYIWGLCKWPIILFLIRYSKSEKITIFKFISPVDKVKHSRSKSHCLSWCALFKQKVKDNYFDPHELDPMENNQRNVFLFPFPDIGLTR